MDKKKNLWDAWSREFQTWDITPTHLIELKRLGGGYRCQRDNGREQRAILVLGPCVHIPLPPAIKSLRSSYDPRWTVRSINVVGESYSFHFAVSCVAASTRSQEQAISATMAEGSSTKQISEFDRSVSSRICTESTADMQHLSSEAGRISPYYSPDWRDVCHLSAIKPGRKIHSEKD